MRSRRNVRNAAVVGLLAAVLAFVATVQVRSQANVEQTLEGQDPTALAFLIDDLHRANDGLAAEAARLTARRDSLATGGDAAAESALRDEAQRLSIVEGLVPVQGPGVVVTVDAPLSPLDLEDAANNLRAAGAEALAINDRRVVTGSVFRGGPSSISIDGGATAGPWVITAVGDPTRLRSAADLLTRSLRADARVRSADFRYSDGVAIRATVAPRPFLYGS